jgi:hypothetical protein
LTIMNRTWTVFCATDSARARHGLSLTGAADALLSAGKTDWEVRPMPGGGFRVWTSDQSGVWIATRYLSSESDRAEAEDEIFRQVVGDEFGDCVAMSDEEYRKMMRATEA